MFIQSEKFVEDESLIALLGQSFYTAKDAEKVKESKGDSSVMHIAQRQEQFSRAYVHAVASVAGYTHYKPEVDDDSIDLGIAGRGSGGTIRSPRLELQLKCAYKHNVIGATGASYSISIKNYNDLRDPNVLVPRILVVVIVPQTINDWIFHSSDNEEIVLRHCGYWVSLRGRPQTPNLKNISISPPSSNLFTVNSLEDLMQKVANGEVP